MKSLRFVADLDKFKMMAAYYVNKYSQPNGDHEVHAAGCFMPPSEDRVYLGDFTNCKDAITAAHKKYRQVNGCYTCSKECYVAYSEIVNKH